MPQVNIQGVGKVNFPEGMTPEQIQQAIEKDILPKAKPSAPAQEEYAREKPPLGARIGRGAQDVVDRLAQLTVAAGEKLGGYPEGLGDTLTQNLNEENAQYEKDRGPNAGIDLARIVGNAGMQAPLVALPGGGATALGRAGAGAISGAASGFLQYDPTNSLKGTAKNTGTGAAVGAVVAPIAGAVSDKAGQAIRWLTGRAKGVGAASSADDILRAVPDIENVPAQLRGDLIAEAQAQIKATGKLNAEEIARKANLIAQGVKPTKSMVTRSPTDWTLERNLQKLAQSPDEQIGRVGQELTDVYQGNNQALVSKLTGMSEQLPKGTQEAHGMAVMQSLDDLSKATQKQVSELYETVRLAKGDDLASDARQLVSTLDDLKDNTYAEKLVSSVTNKLRRYGMLDSDGKLTSKTLTVTQAEELRKFVNRLPNDFGKGDIIKAIDADVLSGMGDDAFGAARKAASERFSTLANPSTQKALNTLGELTQGKTAQNFIKSQVVDAADQDVATLVKTLSKLPPGEAAQSLSALQAGVLQHFQEKAINVNSGQFSGAAFNKAVDDFGLEKLTRIFGPERSKEIRNLARAGIDATYQPAFSAVNNSNTAPMLLSMMQKARAVPGIPLIVTDEAQKLTARSGYKSQLSDALAARPSRELPKLGPRAQEFIRLFAQSGAPASATVLNQSRQGTDQKPKERK